MRRFERVIKRSTAAIMAAMMVTSMLPVTALADDEPAEEENVSAEAVVQNPVEVNAITQDVTSNNEEISVMYDNSALSIIADGYEAIVSATGVSNSGGGSAISVNVQNGGSSVVNVTGDVSSANGFGIEINGGTARTNTIIVDGTVSGKNAAICKGENVPDNPATVVVWKAVVKDGDGNIAVKNTIDQNSNPVIVRDEDFEKKINYIIKVEQPDVGGTLTAKKEDGTPLDSFYDLNGEHIPTALEGDKVVLKIDINDGYEVIGAYGDKGKSKTLEKNPNGDYFYVVPRGGGALLSVRLQLKAQNADAYNSETMSIAQNAVAKEMPIAVEKPAIVVIAPLVSLTDATGTVQLNLYPSGVFSAHLRDGRNVSGRFVLIDDVLTLISNDNVRMPVADDGSLNLIVGEETFSFILPADIIATLRAILR